MWKVHHQGCVRKRVRQGAAPQASVRLGCLGQETASGEERPFLKHSEAASDGGGWSCGQSCLSGW